MTTNGPTQKMVSVVSTSDTVSSGTRSTATLRRTFSTRSRVLSIAGGSSLDFD